MYTITQTVEITADRRIILDIPLPDDFPLGTTQVNITITPVSEKKKTVKSILKFAGCLADSKIFAGDPVEIQRALRAEWDRDWDLKV